jgi:hypothetical protein
MDGIGVRTFLRSPEAWVALRRPGFLHGVCGETCRGGPSVYARSSVDARRTGPARHVRHTAFGPSRLARHV